MGNRLAVRVSCDDTPIFFVSALLLVDDGQTAPYCLLLRPPPSWGSSVVLRPHVLGGG
jgi:hypothetical protein